jgi:hypothetical protein
MKTPIATNGARRYFTKGAEPHGSTATIPKLRADTAETFLNEKQLADRWGISIKKLQADRFSGRGCGFVKIGRLIRYRLSDVEAYEQANLRSSTSQGDAQ